MREIFGEIIQTGHVVFSVDRDEGLEDLAVTEHWDKHLHCPITELTDCSVYKKMLAKIFLLKDMWRHREPKVIIHFKRKIIKIENLHLFQYKWTNYRF